MNREQIERLRTYASIYRHPRRVVPGGQLHQPNEFDLAAAEALEFQADYIEQYWRG